MTAFTGAAVRLQDIDLPLVGRLIGVGEDEIHAILDTETAGTGFDKLNRPRMLFEPHIFYRQLRAADMADKLELAVKQGLAYPTWGEHPYPPDSYPRLAGATRISPELAARSASWGLGQIMGFNFGLAGYRGACEMAVSFMQSEKNQLMGMVRFIVSAGLDDELRAHNWKGFARGYNGAGFEKNGYDKKLALAFKKWQNIKDTPIPAGV
jgi:hypothetical protein